MGGGGLGLGLGLGLRLELGLGLECHSRNDRKFGSARTPPIHSRSLLASDNEIRNETIMEG